MIFMKPRTIMDCCYIKNLLNFVVDLTPNIRLTTVLDFCDNVLHVHCM